jgi:hypothetical protein
MWVIQAFFPVIHMRTTAQASQDLLGAFIEYLSHSPGLGITVEVELDFY